MKTQITAIPKLYIGIDINKRNWKVHCSTDLFAGKSFSISPDPEQILNYVSKYFLDYQVTTAYEADCHFYFFDDDFIIVFKIFPLNNHSYYL